jgi:hypothetical protein
MLRSQYGSKPGLLTHLPGEIAAGRLCQAVLQGISSCFSQKLMKTVDRAVVLHSKHPANGSVAGQKHSF